MEPSDSESNQISNQSTVDDINGKCFPYFLQYQQCRQKGKGNSSGVCSKYLRDFKECCSTYEIQWKTDAESSTHKDFTPERPGMKVDSKGECELCSL